MRPYGDLGIYFRMEYTEKGNTFASTIKIEESELYDAARQGSAKVRDFLRHRLNDALINPLLDQVLKDMVIREKEDKERERIFGPGPMTPEKMKAAINDLAGQRREEKE